jgi:hypothetical protein
MADRLAALRQQGRDEHADLAERPPPPSFLRNLTSSLQALGGGGNDPGDSGYSGWLCGAEARCCARQSPLRTQFNPMDEHRRTAPHEESGRNGASEVTQEPNVAKELAAAKERAEREAVLNTVRMWMQCRENADANGAAELSTPDVHLRTPRAEPIRGIQQGACKLQHVPCGCPRARSSRSDTAPSPCACAVMEKVYRLPAPPSKTSTELVATHLGPDEWQVVRSYTIERSGHTIGLRQEWRVVCAPWPLISEVSSTYSTNIA